MATDLKMAIIRPIGLPVSRNFYNSQEIGLARGLSLCGISVDVFVAGTGPGVQVTEVASRGSGPVRLLEVPFLAVPEISHALYPRLRGLLLKGNYDLIQVNEENELTCYLVARFARRRGIPVVVYQGMYEQITGRIRAAFQSCYDRILLPGFRDAIALALTKTERARRHLERKGFQRLLTLPVGLDPTPFENPEPRDWRGELGIGPDQPILLYVGIFENRRNVDFMLDLARDLAGDGVTLVMAGGGPEHARITRRVADEALGNVKLVGKVSQAQLPSLYRQSSLFLLPSNYEIYGMVVLEAMYFGTPVLSTSTAGPEDIIASGVDGVLFQDLQRDAWCRAVREITGDPDTLAAMGQAAASKVQQDLTWEALAKRYAGEVIGPLLQERAAQGGAPGSRAGGR